MVLNALMLASALAGCVWGPSEQKVGAEDPRREKKAHWQPGDDIPGWEGLDVECPLAESAGHAVVQLPDLMYEAIVVGNYEDGPTIQAFVKLADYSDTQDGAVVTYPGAGPYTDVAAKDLSAESLTWMTGWYGPGTERSGAAVIAAISAPVGGTSTDWGDEVLLCLSRVRPDEMRGVIYVIYHSNTLAWLHYRRAVIEYPFESFFQGSIDGAFEITPLPTEDYSDFAFYYVGGANYDEIWDWDAITDPVIRDTVYERYKPYNWP